MENNGLLYVYEVYHTQLTLWLKKKMGGIKWYKPQRWLSCLK